MECKDKIQRYERPVKVLIAVEDERNDSNGERMPQLRSTELWGKIYSFSDSGKQLDCRNFGRHKSPVELSKLSIKTIESTPAVSGILEK